MAKFESEYEIGMKAAKYDIIIRALLSCYDFNSWSEKIEICATNTIEALIEGLEPDLLKTRTNEIMKKWIKTHPEEAKEKGIIEED